MDLSYAITELEIIADGREAAMRSGTCAGEPASHAQQELRRNTSLSCREAIALLRKVQAGFDFAHQVVGGDSVEGV